MTKLYELEGNYNEIVNKYVNDVVGETMTIRDLLQYGFNSLNDEENGYLGYNEEDFKEENNGYVLDTLIKVLYDSEDTDGYTILYIKKESE